MLKSLKLFKEANLQGKGEQLLNEHLQKELSKWRDTYVQYLKSNNIPLEVVHDQGRFLSPHLWSLVHGPEITRILARKYEIIGEDGVPHETELRLPVGVEYTDRKQQKVLLAGQLFNPAKAMTAPSISFERIEGQKDYFVAVSDIDGGTSPKGKKSTTVLYYGEESEKGSKTFLPYIPPHPARGSGVHRIVVTVGTRAKSVPSMKRHCSIAEMVAKLEGSILGVSFFRTCWTKQVSDVYSRLGKKEAVYGEVEAAYKGPAINTLFF